ncbi:uncharacterized protein LOC132407081 isoform X1 [Hypanus sabinus]|uniref:uncharacterized protein LOC132407081 isoform X1 n=1 Tax=Hypanus sabinus TaxID=79690 RepID=UPI0028C4A18A|nr:uncharacterized protein LOC132407081 isoform X1 [Hypanus sabinus]
MTTRSSVKSLPSSDRGSRTSSSKAAHARAKAEAAKVRLRYARQEAKLKMEAAAREAENQKEAAAREAENRKEAAAREAENQLKRTRIAVELEVLTLEREKAAARVEAEFIEDAEEMQDLVDVKSTSAKTRLERTSDYVQSQTDWKIRSSTPYLLDYTPRHEESQRGPIASHASKEDNLPLQLCDEVKNERADDKYFSTPNLPDLARREAKAEFRTAKSMTEVRPQSYTRQHISPACMPLAIEPLAQYLARRDLITSGLYQFDDKPENYCAQYATFTNAIDGIQLRATQELDLMAKCLGKESCEQVRRIRSVYINNPELALRKAWERLREGYAAPEIIEAALYRRLENFPKVSTKDHRLRELGDLLMEIQGAKEGGNSTGLVYLDTPSGIRQIVDKLPFGLQDTWVSVASEYKEDHNGRFPPFEYFTSLCAGRRRSETTLASWVKEAVQFTPSQIYPL